MGCAGREHTVPPGDTHAQDVLSALATHAPSALLPAPALPRRSAPATRPPPACLYLFAAEEVACGLVPAPTLPGVPDSGSTAAAFAPPTTIPASAGAGLSDAALRRTWSTDTLTRMPSRITLVAAQLAGMEPGEGEDSDEETPVPVRRLSVLVTWIAVPS